MSPHHYVPRNAITTPIPCPYIYTNTWNRKLFDRTLAFLASVGDKIAAVYLVTQRVWCAGAVLGPYKHSPPPAGRGGGGHPGHTGSHWLVQECQDTGVFTYFSSRGQFGRVDFLLWGETLYRHSVVVLSLLGQTIWMLRRTEGGGGGNSVCIRSWRW